MFKFRTLTICLKLRVVVTVLWVVSCRVLHLFSSHHLSLFELSASVVAQDLSSFPQHYSPVSRQSETWCSHGMKRKIHKESTQRTKVALGLFLPCIYIFKKKCSATATGSPPNLYSKTLLPSEKSYRIQYITFCFTSLELQNKRAGNRKKNLPSLHWTRFSVGPHRNQREQLNCIFFFFFF